MAGTWDMMPVGARSNENGTSVFGGDIYRNWYNEARHLWCFYVENVGWTVAHSMTPIYSIGWLSLSVVPNFYYVGRVVLRGSGHVLFYSSYLDTWVFRSGNTVVEPRSYKDLDGETDLGDAWFAGSNGPLPYPGGSVSQMTFRPRGTETGDNLVLALAWPRWVRGSGGEVVDDYNIEMSPCGFYKAADQTADDIVIGTPIWKDDAGRNFVREEKDENGRWIYGNIRYNGGFWSSTGTTFPRSSEEPNFDNPVVFRDEENRAVFTLTFYGNAAGANVSTRYVAEACVWRE